MSPRSLATRAPSRRRSSTRGVAALEFALVLLPFCLLLFGMIDYGWYFFVDLACTNAVREGARTATTITGQCGSSGSTAARTAGTNVITTYLAGVLPAAGYAPAVTVTCNPIGATGDPQYRFDLLMDFTPVTGMSLIPLPAGGAAGTARVRTSATMRGVP